MSESLIEIHNPIFGRPATDSSRRAIPFPERDEGDTLRIAFIDNEKPNTSYMLGLVEEGLSSRYRVQAQHLLKGGAAHPAPREIIQAAAGADLVLLSTAD